MTRILLVEDDAELRLLLEHVLLGADYEVDTAASVEAALALLGSAAYDLVLADGRLEDGTGMMVAEKAVEAGSKTLIITGYAFELPREQLGRYEFLLKPVRPSELLDAVERALNPSLILEGSAGVIVSRRAIVLSCTSLVAALEAFPAMSSQRVDLTYLAGRLSWPGGEARAACGRGGVRADKREGDGASPAGRFPLVSAYYRPDRFSAPPATALPLTALSPSDGWCDDPSDPQYNRPVRLPYPARHERMWRDDGLYDLVVAIGYNTDPPVPGGGSAIFLHIAAPDFGPTEGCIAVAGDVLGGLLGLLGPGSAITIRP